MIKKLFFISVLLFGFYVLYAFPALASGTWVEQDHGTMQTVRGIVKAGDTLIAVGNSSYVMRSFDEGTSWVLSNKISNVWWQDVTLESDGDVVVVGDSGVYASSSDNGATWTTSSSGVSNHLYGIDRSDAYGYIVGSDGAVLYLANGRWVSASPNVTETLYDVQDNGDGTAWIVGAGGRLLKAGGGGTSWTDLGRIAADDLQSVYFESSTTGWVVGDKGTLKQTTNGGTSWGAVSVTGLNTQDLYDIQVSDDSMVVVGDKIILMSEDGGDTWSAQDFTGDNITFYAAVYDSTGGLWAAGTDFDVWSSVWQYEVDQVEEVDEVETQEVVEAEPNNLIKIACEGETDVNDPCRAVYFYGTDEKRHAFPNEKVFFTWYEDFDDVIEVTSEFMSNLSLGPNVTYHPGTKMVKFQTVRTVYAVSAAGVLRAIASEDVASDLYGEDWNQRIDDISDAFLGNYSFGEGIDSSDDYDIQTQESSVAELDDNF
ncbi:hypothetical protein HZA87_06415 [Candidatus Uhrbacteria bacterium]|nr:hypothetical protein [Candidatus Uhrbacteria bacterium]